MAIRYYTEERMQISESDNILTVSVGSTAAGSRDVQLFNCDSNYYYKPVITGEDYPSLARIWDNREDDIYNSL